MTKAEREKAYADTKTIVPIHNQLQKIIERLTRIEEAE